MIVGNELEKVKKLQKMLKIIQKLLNNKLMKLLKTEKAIDNLTVDKTELKIN